MVPPTETVLPFITTEVKLVLLLSGVTKMFTVYSRVVASSAVTVTVTTLLPECSAVAPETVRDAAASAVVATTITEVVPFATVTVAPSTTVEPLTVKRLKSVFLLRAKTVTLKWYSRTEPLAAVTRTVTVLSPVCRPVAPRTSTRAPLSVAVAETPTEAVPLATVMFPLSTIVAPLTSSELRVLSELRGVTYTVIL